jgi:hypothetical protein
MQTTFNSVRFHPAFLTVRGLIDSMERSNEGIVGVAGLQLQIVNLNTSNLAVGDFVIVEAGLIPTDAGKDFVWRGHAMSHSGLRDTLQVQAKATNPEPVPSKPAETPSPAAPTAPNASVTSEATNKAPVAVEQPAASGLARFMTRQHSNPKARSFVRVPGATPTPASAPASAPKTSGFITKPAAQRNEPTRPAFVARGTVGQAQPAVEFEDVGF